MKKYVVVEVTNDTVITSWQGNKDTFPNGKPASKAQPIASDLRTAIKALNRAREAFPQGNFYLAKLKTY